MKTSSVEQLMAKLQAPRKRCYELLEAKQLAEVLARHRTKVRFSLDEYRVLKQKIAAETDAIEKLYLGYEAMFTRDHLRDAFRLYQMICRDFYEAYQSYMDGLKPSGKTMPSVSVTKKVANTTSVTKKNTQVA